MAHAVAEGALSKQTAAADAATRKAEQAIKQMAQQQARFAEIQKTMPSGGRAFQNEEYGKTPGKGEGKRAAKKQAFFNKIRAKKKGR